MRCKCSVSSRIAHHGSVSEMHALQMQRVVAHHASAAKTLTTKNCSPCVKEKNAHLK